LLARALSDETLASRLVHDLLASMLAVAPPAARRPKCHLAALIPAAHGVTAIATFLFAVLVAGAISGDRAPPRRLAAAQIRMIGARSAVREVYTMPANNRRYAPFRAF
jgi:hypothetical protein